MSLNDHFTSYAVTPKSKVADKAKPKHGFEKPATNSIGNHYESASMPKK